MPSKRPPSPSTTPDSDTVRPSRRHLPAPIVSPLRMQQAAELLASAKQECFETHQLWQDASNWGDSHSEVEAALKARLDINAETQADLENFIWLATNRALGIDDPRPEQIELAFKLAGRSPEKKGFCKCVGNGAGPSGVLERTIDLRDADVDWSTPSSSFLADEVEPRVSAL